MGSQGISNYSLTSHESVSQCVESKKEEPFYTTPTFHLVQNILPQQSSAEV